jgi:hypothetical protein
MPRRLSHRRRRRQTLLVVALYVNAGLLLSLLLAVMSRGSASAYAAPVTGAQPIAGGNGLYLMPGQFANNIWGCYVMDVGRQTLCAYEYVQGRKQLQLVAARDFSYDIQLREYNSPQPSPDEVRRLVNLTNAPVRGNPNEQPPPPEVPGSVGPETAPAQGPTTRPGERSPDRPPQPGDPDFVPKASDINNPPK